MAYQSLYRRYRPRRFAEVRGQEHLVRALQNAVREGRVGHAYLFSGPRGTGKTSTARILAKVLNCEAPADGEPCCECESCLAIEAGTSFDVHELDAASNNKVEDVRDLIAKIALGTPGRTKVYILDEVHMLSTAASNALLKTLEEPPEHVVFVLATTDPQKVLPTIRSRTQHFDVHLLSADELTELATFIVGDAGLDVGPEAIEYVVRAGAGSARDMESALDQVAAAGGVPDDGEALDELVEALCDRDVGRSLVAVEAAIGAGRSPRVLGEALLGRLRDVFLATMKADLGRLPDGERQRVEAQAGRLGAAGATRALEVVGEVFVGIQDAPDPRVLLEVALVRLTRPQLDTSPAALVERIERLERGQAPAAGRPPADVGEVPATAPARSRTTGTSRPGSGGEDTGPTGPGGEPSAADEAAPRATGAPSGGGPAAEARQRLAERKGSSGRSGPERPARGRGGRRTTDAGAEDAAPPGRSAAATRSRGPADAGDDGGTTTREAGATRARRQADRGGDGDVTSPDLNAGSADAGAPTEPDGGGATGSAGASPGLDEVVDAWQAGVLAGLSQKVRVRLGAGRWVSVTDGTAAFGLPNAIHRERCQGLEPEVEAALADRFGPGLAVRFVVAAEDDAADQGPAPSGEEGDDEDLATVDVRSLEDADVGGADDLARVTEMFPGAELVADEE